MDGYLLVMIGATTSTIAALAASVFLVLRDGRRRHREHVQLRVLEIFGAAIPRVQKVPPELVSWAKLANAARGLFPHAFVSLDAAIGDRFPFPAGLVEGVRARWTSEWLTWEREHDAEYKGRASEIDHNLSVGTQADAQRLRGRLAEIEQEKLLRYQERYEQFVRVSKELSDLHENTSRP
jgi:hypothetical protein